MQHNKVCPYNSSEPCRYQDAENQKGENLSCSFIISYLDWLLALVTIDGNE